MLSSGAEKVSALLTGKKRPKPSSRPSGCGEKSFDDNGRRLLERRDVQGYFAVLLLRRRRRRCDQWKDRRVGLPLLDGLGEGERAVLDVLFRAAAAEERHGWRREGGRLHTPIVANFWPTPKSKLNLRLVIMETVASLARAHAIALKAQLLIDPLTHDRSAQLLLGLTRLGRVFSDRPRPLEPLRDLLWSVYSQPAAGPSSSRAPIASALARLIRHHPVARVDRILARTEHSWRPREDELVFGGSGARACARQRILWIRRVVDAAGDTVGLRDRRDELGEERRRPGPLTAVADAHPTAMAVSTTRLVDRFRTRGLVSHERLFAAPDAAVTSTGSAG